MKLIAFIPVSIEFKKDDYKHTVMYQTMMMDWLSQWKIPNNYGIMICDIERAFPEEFPPTMWAQAFIDTWRQVRLSETVPLGYLPLEDFSFLWVEKTIDLDTKASADLNRGVGSTCGASIRSMLNYNQTVEIVKPEATKRETEKGIILSSI